MYGIYNLVNLDILETNNTSINFGKTQNEGNSSQPRTVGGSNLVGDGSVNFNKDTNFNICCDKPTANSIRQNKANITSQPVRKKVLNVVERKKNKTISTNKKRNRNRIRNRNKQN